ncbi:MAG: aminopeptidase P family protein [Alphaproteobacteria bacterium]|nr:aminopeptidase P family protein [Alphaproteobacteria bacterium]
MNSRIYRCIADLKQMAGASFAETLGNWPRVCSERDFAQEWLQNLRRHSQFFEDGWYMPPPHDLITLFGKPIDGYSRVCQPSFRLPQLWPSSDCFYDREDLFAAYASPVDRASKLIGDFGFTLYAGSSPEIQEHCEAVLRISLEIAHCARVGMTFAKLYSLAMDCARQQGLCNDIFSPNDQELSNIGHSIPLSWPTDSTHQTIAKAQGFAEIVEAIRVGRKFLNAVESQPIEENMAFTIEPRLSAVNLPQVWFHLTVIVHQGTAHVVHGLRPALEKIGQNRLLKLLPGDS